MIDLVLENLDGRLQLIDAGLLVTKHHKADRRRAAHRQGQPPALEPEGVRRGRHERQARGARGPDLVDQSATGNRAGAGHPERARGAGRGQVRYPHPSRGPVLKETLGVLLYQEQCIRVAMVAARFTAGDADQLRRAMTRSRSREAMAVMRERFIAGCGNNAIDAVTADGIFDKLAGFATSRFCKSHAANFALVPYPTTSLNPYRTAEV